MEGRLDSLSGTQLAQGYILTYSGLWLDSEEKKR